MARRWRGSPSLAIDIRHWFALRFVICAARPLWPCPSNLRCPVRTAQSALGSWTCAVSTGSPDLAFPQKTHEVNGMSEWNAMTYEGKDTILRVVREQAGQMFA